MVLYVCHLQKRTETSDVCAEKVLMEEIVNFLNTPQPPAKRQSKMQLRSSQQMLQQCQRQLQARPLKAV